MIHTLLIPDPDKPLPLMATLAAWSSRFIFQILLLVILASISYSVQSDELPIKTPVIEELSVDDETDLSIVQYPANGNQLIVWIPSYASPQNIVHNIASQLNKQNIEVWYSDLLEARFLPKTGSSIYQIPNKDIASILDLASRKRHKKIFIYAESRVVVPVLLALREKQMSANGLTKFGGVIMNSPYLYVETPNPGVKPRLMPIASNTNLPLYIIQPKNSPRFWQLEQSIPALKQSGSDVYIQVLKDIRGRFLFRPDATAKEEELAAKFGQLLSKAMTLLNSINQKPREVTNDAITAIRKVRTKKERYLQKYQGSPQPPPLKLKTLSGDELDLKQFAKQVVLVNFWTTWCPPCVREMPSMQRLSETLLGDPFIILGVNIAEDKKEIKKFLAKKVNIDFPILLDHSGEVMRQWNVMAFPTSFVIDKNGKIRYALFGSIDWDKPEIINKIQTLLDE